MSCHTLKWVRPAPDAAHSRINGAISRANMARTPPELGLRAYGNEFHDAYQEGRYLLFLRHAVRGSEMETCAEERLTVSTTSLSRSQDWVHHVISLLDAARHQLYRKETAERTILKAASLLRSQLDPPTMREAPNAGGRVLAW